MLILVRVTTLVKIALTVAAVALLCALLAGSGFGRHRDPADPPDPARPPCVSARPHPDNEESARPFHCRFSNSPSG